MSASYTETDIEEIAAKLGGDSRGCLCPAHNDHKPSLSLGVGEGGRLLYHCFAGCSPEDVREALRAKGVLKNGDATGAEPKSKVVATYTYRDEMGQPLYRAVRHEPKRFTLERYEGGRWKKGRGAMGGVRRVPYNLPNVIPAKDVVLVEGEKDADNLNALGFIATTCPQGAKSWKKKYAEFLIGKRVTIIPDNDPAGRLLLEKAASSIRTKAARVAFLNLEGLGEKEDVSDWLARGGTADQLRELITAAPEWVPKRDDGVPDSEDGRTAVYLSVAKRNEVLRQCAGLLKNIIYMRGLVPVMLTRAVDCGGKEVEDRDGEAVDVNGVRYRPGTLLFSDAAAGRVKYHLDERAVFFKYARREDEWHQTDCPKEDLAGAIVESAVDLGFRWCSGIIQTPLLTDGEVVCGEGYDQRTGLILDTGDLVLNLPEEPSREDAAAALERLLRPFRGWLDKGTASRTAIAAGALTAVLRPSLGASPGILLDGNNPAVGKGKMARAFGAIACGGVPAVITEGHNDAELEKRLAAAIIQGAGVILLDNLQRHLASSTLESMLTEPVADIRDFGKLRGIKAECRALVLATANNASVRIDTARRFVPIRIVVDDESPELRPFDFDPVAEAIRDRIELLEAAFTIILAWQRERDRSENKKHKVCLGSYEDWSELVAAPVSWLTDQNPIDLIEARKKDDTRRSSEKEVIQALHNWQQCLTDSNGHPRAYWAAKEAATGISADLWEPLLPTRGPDPGPSAGSVGKWLGKRRDAVFANLKLEATIDAKNKGAWTIRNLDARTPPPAPAPKGPEGPPVSGDTEIAEIPLFARAERQKTPFQGLEEEGKGDLCHSGKASENIPAISVSPEAGPSKRTRTLKGKRSPALDPKPAAAGGILELGEHRVPYRLLTERDEARAAVGELIVGGKVLGIDFETTGDPERSANPKKSGLDIVSAKPRLLQLSAEDRILVVDLSAIGGLDVLSDLLANLKGVAHNAAFETNLLVKAGICIELDCTMVADQLLTGTKGDSLAKLTERYLDLKIGKEMQKADWSAAVLADEHVRYAAQDAWLALKLWDILKKKVDELGSTRVYELTRAAQPVVAGMRLAGMPIDRQAHARLAAELDAEVQRTRVPLAQAMGVKNPCSTKELNAWLTAALGGERSSAFRQWPRTKGGQLGTGEKDVEEGLNLLPAEPARIVRELLMPFREATKLASAYGSNFAQHIHPVTERVHGDFKLSSTITGRMSCSDPNVQNVPRDPRFRALYRAPEGRKLVIGDYSMAEMRVAAMYANEKKMLAMFEAGEDVHTCTAAALLNKPVEEVSKSERQLAKAVGFGLLFGQSARGLQRYAANTYGVEMTEDEADTHRTGWLRTYPDLRCWQRRQEDTTRAEMVARTRCGRVRRWTSRVYEEQGGYRKTEALNTPIQGSAAEALLYSLVRLSKTLRGLDAIIINATHDEIVLEAGDADAPRAKEVLEECMTAGMLDVFPDASTKGLVEAHIGTSWADK